MPARLTESELQRLTDLYEVERQQRGVEWGECFCGCTSVTHVATRNRFRDGTVKGLPMRYVSGHNRWLSPVHYVEQDRGYSTPCWIWQRGTNELGYGRTYDNGIGVKAHRFYYEQEYGSMPPNLDLDHLCRVPACVNPQHLEPVTHAENNRRGARAKLTWSDVHLIRELAANGVPRKQIAVQFGVHRKYIYQIVSHTTWSSP